MQTIFSQASGLEISLKVIARISVIILSRSITSFSSRKKRSKRLNELRISLILKSIRVPCLCQPTALSNLLAYTPSVQVYSSVWGWVKVHPKPKLRESWVSTLPH
jgi:hypothetical protein